MSSMNKLSVFLYSLSLIGLTACNIDPSTNYSNPYQNNYNNPYQGNYNNYGSPSHGAKPVMLYDLINQDYQYSVNRIQSRGFEPKGNAKNSDGYLTWWYNRKTDQCFEMHSSGGKVRSLNNKPTSDCKNAPQGANWDKSGQSSNTNKRFPGVPQTAKAACIKRFGADHFDHIKTISPLRPGYWEIIVKGKGQRQVACTVDQYGNISDWVDM